MPRRESKVELNKEKMLGKEEGLTAGTGLMR